MANGQWLMREPAAFIVARSSDLPISHEPSAIPSSPSVVLRLFLVFGHQAESTASYLAAGMERYVSVS